jgi:hypothetical protein
MKKLNRTIDRISRAYNKLKQEELEGYYKDTKLAD